MANEVYTALGFFAVFVLMALYFLYDKGQTAAISKTAEDAAAANAEAILAADAATAASNEAARKANEAAAIANANLADVSATLAANAAALEAASAETASLRAADAAAATARAVLAESVSTSKEKAEAAAKIAVSASKNAAKAAYSASVSSAAAGKFAKAAKESAGTTLGVANSEPTNMSIDDTKINITATPLQGLPAGAVSTAAINWHKIDNAPIPDFKNPWRKEKLFNTRYNMQCDPGAHVVAARTFNGSFANNVGITCSDGKSFTVPGHGKGGKLYTFPGGASTVHYKISTPGGNKAVTGLFNQTYESKFTCPNGRKFAGLRGYSGAYLGTAQIGCQ